MERVFLALVRLGIGKNETADIPERINWERIRALANAQGLSAIVLDGIEELKKRDPHVILPEKPELTQWIGEVLQGYEQRYEFYCRAIAEMASFYNSHGFKMMVVKGYACSLDWPKPEHRPTGDIDIWQFGEYKNADALLASEKELLLTILTITTPFFPGAASLLRTIMTLSMYITTSHILH